MPSTPEMGMKLRHVAPKVIAVVAVAQAAMGCWADVPPPGFHVQAHIAICK